MRTSPAIGLDARSGWHRLRWEPGIHVLVCDGRVVAGNDWRPPVLPFSKSWSSEAYGYTVARASTFR